jgi:hypothetical protein
MATPAGDLLDVGLDPFSAGPGTIVFEPIGVTITPGCNEAGYRDFNNDNVVDTGETPCLAQGAAAGTHTWQATLGLSNGPCSTATTVTVDLFNVAMPDNELNPRASTNIVYPRPVTGGDRFGGWQVGSAPLIGTAPLDVDANGQAEAGSLAFQNYPSYLLDLANPDGAGAVDPVLPLAVYGGLSRVNGEWIPFYFVQFEAGDLAVPFASSIAHPYKRASSALGHLLQPVAGDPTALSSSPTSITDVCTPTATTTALADTVGGEARATNPATAGTHMTLVWRATQRDLENDGYENNIDTCPAVANVENPRSTAGPDGDGLDSACDPAPGTTNTDEDADGVTNTLDNCPLTVNASQAEGELESPPNYFARAFDGGPAADHMGDACETGNTVTPFSPAATLTAAISAIQYTFTYTSSADPIALGSYIVVESEVMFVTDRNTTSNTLTVKRGASGSIASPHSASATISGIVGITTTLNNKSTPFVFSPTVSNGHFHIHGDVLPQCLGGVDADADGYCAGAQDPADSGSCALTAPPSCSIRHGPWILSAFSHLLGFDTDRSGADSLSSSDPGGIGEGIPCPGGASDICPDASFDGDFHETYVASNPAQGCSADNTLNNETLDSWIFDFNDDRQSNISDVVAFGPSFNKFINAPGGNTRFDLNSDGLVSISDVIFLGTYGWRDNCRRTDGIYPGLQ